MGKSISSILYSSFPPYIKNLQDGIPYIKKYNTTSGDNYIVKKQTNFCFNYENKVWFEPCYKDSFSNGYKIRYLKTMISSDENFKKNIIYSMNNFINDILSDSLRDVNTTSPYDDGIVSVAEKRDCMRDTNDCINKREALSRLLYSTPVYIEDDDKGKMIYLLDNEKLSSYLLEFFDTYNLYIRKDITNDINNSRADNIVRDDTLYNINVVSNMYYSEVIDNIIIQLLPFFRKNETEYHSILENLYNIQNMFKKYILNIDNNDIKLYKHTYYFEKK